MRLLLFKTAQEASQWTAAYTAQMIQTINNENRTCVLGLPTGGTILETYAHLVKRYEAKTLSFSRTQSFNMDEYVGLDASHPQSYHHFMHTHLFSKIDMPKSSQNILDGTAKDPVKECNDYEEKIRKAGGIDLFLGGIGGDGHIAFNEPFSSLSSRTRLKALNRETKMDNARFFDGDVTKTPNQSMTVGVQTILDARQVAILAFGKRKATALANAIEGPITQSCTASALQMHSNALIVCDLAAASEMKISTLSYFANLEDHYTEFTKEHSPSWSSMFDLREF